MPLSANARLGPYEIRSTLGAGGMGEVYQAFDTRLNRSVAIKVLSADHAITAELRARFEREARAIAAFNHPNIVAVYDFGIDSDRQYIVSELVEGSSLRSLLNGKPVSLRKLLDIAVQTADGLAAAHAAGFVHRDLKPENIMLTKDGRVKIVDFGLARQDPGPASDPDSTLTFAPNGADSGSGTKAGAVLGTPRYMSPEQAVGNPIDYRSDQFSFGLILYELASGKQAFAKDSSVETMAAIVREEPPSLDENLPPPLRWIIDRCLQKEPDQRYESTRDLYQELRNLRDHLSEAHSSGAVASVVAVRVKRRRWIVPALCAACIFITGVLVYLLKPSGQDIGSYRYTPFATDADDAIWSPDGKSVAYAARVNGIFQVFLRYLNSRVPVQLTHQKLDTRPFGWSSDRSHLIVGEWTQINPMLIHAKLYSVPTVGGDLEFIMETDCFDCSLSPDGKAFVTLAPNKNKAPSIEVSGPFGTPMRPYTSASLKSSLEELDASPSLSFSPDGKQILLTIPVPGKSPETWVLPYPPGSEPIHQIPTLQKFSSSNPASVSWMPDSRHLVISYPPDNNSASNLWMADTNSNVLMPLTTGTDEQENPAVSPDGKSILYTVFTVRTDVTSISVEDGSTKTLITSGHFDGMATWSVKQARLAWLTNRSGPWEIWVRLADGSERPAVTAADFPGGVEDFESSNLSPEGDRLIFAAEGIHDLSGHEMNSSRLWLASVTGGTPVQLTNVAADSEGDGSWSPDGRQFAYIGGQGSELPLMTVKTSGNATPSMLKKNIEGPYLPDWSPTGNWITYRDSNGWSLISPDGKNLKALGKIETPYLAFSRDGKLLYGIKTGENGGNLSTATLFSIDPVTLKQKVIKELEGDLAPRSFILGNIRFSLAPDGKSFIYPTSSVRGDIWMLTGYRQPAWRARIAESLHLK
jgi:Tol biopolymer transport system component